MLSLSLGFCNLLRLLPRLASGSAVKGVGEGGAGEGGAGPRPPLLGILGCATHLSFQEAEFTLLPLQAASLVLRLRPLHLLL